LSKKYIKLSLGKHFKLYCLIAYCFLFLKNNLLSQRLILGSELEGSCSFYNDKFDGLKTTSGELYDKSQFTAAHRTLPFNALIAVTNLRNSITIIVRVNDRGPHTQSRMLDVSGAAADILGIKNRGVEKVKMRVVGFDNFQYLEPIDPPDMTAEIRNSKNE
jgi:rare lipoprotein A